MDPPQHPTAIQNLPGDVLSKILIRLPAKPLAQMRCISKPWNAFLSQPSFIKSHLHRSIHNNDDEILLILTDGLRSTPFCVTAHFSRSPHLVVDNPSTYDTVRFLGSVNGLICFSFKPHNDFVIHIWNPSLSAVLTLPPFDGLFWYLTDYPIVQMHFRFGYDLKMDDYKVFNLTNYNTKRSNLICFTVFAFDYRTYINNVGKIPEVDVYSMRKGSWKSIEDRKFPRHVSGIIDEDIVCVDGHDGYLHWLGYIYNTVKRQTVVAFDLGEEAFSEIPLPDSLMKDDKERCGNGLGVLGGKLCVMSFNQGYQCEVWVMNEYGVPESWVKSNILSPFSTSDHLFPLGFTSNNEFLFASSFSEFTLYDPVGAELKSFNVRPRPEMKIVRYVDSLVWVAPSF